MREAAEVEADEVAVLVVRIQGASKPEAKRLSDTLMRLLLPMLNKVASRFGSTARGSLSHEDLVQVGAIEALKFIPRYDHSRRGATESGSFVQLVYRRALRACAEQMRLHSADVHVSDHAARGDGQVKYIAPPVAMVSRKSDASEDDGISNWADAASRGDASSSHGMGHSTARAGAIDHGETPESQLADRQRDANLRRVVYSLPQEQREIVSWVFGIGRPAASIRDVARQMRLPRSRVTAVIADAQATLRKLLAE